MAVVPIRSPTVPVAPTTVAELVRVCDGTYFNQLLRGRKIGHANETAGVFSLAMRGGYSE
ncbi:hypothetical protein ACFORK_13440 [Paenibacillus sp. GCM10012306]